ncbi:DNA mismatch endonuclease Vsr [Mesorhizobium sp. M4B.F.Ca.ET.089.01.1.1]|nr:DNA mismatch endonuclease Vsr [Mesorhizobium sp. M4B.F.Ca.ET.089.01.1.1]
MQVTKNVLDDAARRKMMAQFRSKDTKPEVMVRRALHRLGYRFRLHRRDLPGKPDIVLPRHQTIILVHGCFWHQHNGCSDARMPRTRQDYWSAKFRRNSERDAETAAALKALGWRVLVVWECDARKPELDSYLASALGHVSSLSAYSDEAGHRFRFEAGQSFRFHSGRRSDLKAAISRTDPGSR